MGISQNVNLVISKVIFQSCDHVKISEPDFEKFVSDFNVWFSLDVNLKIGNFVGSCRNSKVQYPFMLFLFIVSSAEVAMRLIRISSCSRIHSRFPVDPAAEYIATPENDRPSARGNISQRNIGKCIADTLPARPAEQDELRI